MIGGCDLSVAYIDGEWQWLVRPGGRYVEGVEGDAEEAKGQADLMARVWCVSIFSGVMA